MAAPAGYTSSQMTMDDTFSGTSLNSSNWTPEVDPGTVWDNADFGSGYSTGGKTNEAAYFSSAQASVGNGLTLTACQTTSSDVGYSKGFDWVSGAVTSKNPLPSTPGYVQISAEMPDTSDGMWPALWFLPASSAQEFDGFEGGWSGSKRETSRVNSDLFDASGQDQNVWSTGSTNITAGYNTYGFQYIPGHSVTVYFNGKQVYQDADSNISSAVLLPAHRAPGRLVVHVGVAHEPLVEHAEPVHHGHLRGPGLLVDPLAGAVRPPHRFSSPSWSVAAAHLRRRSGPAPEPAPAHRRWGPAVRVPGRTPKDGGV